MRYLFTFLGGCALGAAAILIYLHESAQLAIAAPAPRNARGAVVASLGSPIGGSTISGTTTSVDDVIIPVAGVSAAALRNTFTEPRGGRIHHAIDIMAERGTPVVAAVDGKIRKLFTSRAGGLTIYQTNRAEERIYYYAHLDRYARGITEGMFVPQGTVIGYVGTTGNAPIGAPHLHFSIEILPPTKEWWKGQAIDPYPILMSGGESGTAK